MVVSTFTGPGIGIGFGVGCGFGVGWGFGGGGSRVVHGWFQAAPSAVGRGCRLKPPRRFSRTSFSSCSLSKLFGMPLNMFGLGIGGGCGVGLGLGWGFGNAFGCRYRSSRVQFQGIEFQKKVEGDEAPKVVSQDLAEKSRPYG